MLQNINKRSWLSNGWNERKNTITKKKIIVETNLSVFSFQMTWKVITKAPRFHSIPLKDLLTICSAWTAQQRQQKIYKTISFSHEICQVFFFLHLHSFLVVNKHYTFSGSKINGICHVVSNVHCNMNCHLVCLMQRQRQKQKQRDRKKKYNDTKYVKHRIFIWIKRGWLWFNNSLSENRFETHSNLIYAIHNGSKWANGYTTTN